MVYQAKVGNTELSTAQEPASLLPEGWREIGERVSMLIAKA